MVSIHGSEECEVIQTVSPKPIVPDLEFWSCFCVQGRSIHFTRSFYIYERFFKQPIKPHHANNNSGAEL